eukprot:3662068-Amphidinium_carterae.1
MAEEAARLVVKEKVEADLAFIWEDAKVDVQTQAAFATKGFVSVRLFTNAADSKAELRTLLKEELSLDPTQDPQARMKQAASCSARRLGSGT